MMKNTALLATVLLASGYAASALAADADAGKRVFNKCAVCHSPVAGKNGVGPSLFGVVGRKAASAPGFNYSEALKASGKTWDEASIDSWLEGPQKVAPGTKMSFPGLPKADDRANVIAYLATLK